MRECLNFVKSVNERVLEVQIFAKGLSQADHEDGTVLLAVSITACAGEARTRTDFATCCCRGVGVGPSIETGT